MATTKNHDNNKVNMIGLGLGLGLQQGDKSRFGDKDPDSAILSEKWCIEHNYIYF